MNMKKASMSTNCGFALIFVVMVILILTAGGMLFYYTSMSHKKTSRADRIADISAQIADSGLQRGLFEVRKFLIEEGMEASPTPSKEYLQQGDPMGYFIENRPKDTDGNPIMDGWKVNPDHKEGEPVKYIYKEFKENGPDAKVSYTAVISPGRAPLTYTDEDGKNKIKFFYQFGIRSRPIKKRGTKEVEYAVFNKKTFTKDHRLALISDKCYSPLKTKITGTPVYKFRPQVLEGKAEKIVYGTLTISYQADNVPVWLYVTNEEEGTLVVIDLEHGGEVIRGPINVGPHPCKIWVDQRSFRYVLVANCNTDRFGKEIEDENGEKLTPKLTVVDMAPGNDPEAEPQVISTHEGILMHDFSFRQDPDLTVGYGIDKAGNLYIFDQTSGTLEKVEGFDICASSSDPDACRDGDLREFDYATGGGGIFNSLVLRNDKKLFVTVAKTRQIFELDVAGDSPAIKKTLSLPTYERAGGYKLAFENTIIPHDLPLTDYYTISFQSVVATTSNQYKRDSFIYRDFYLTPGAGLGLSHQFTKQSHIEAPTGAKGLRRDSIDASLAIHEEPYVYYPVFSVYDVDENTKRSSMDFYEINLTKTAENSPQVSKVIPTIPDLPTRLVVTSASGGPNCPWWKCGGPEGGGSDLDIGRYTYVSSAATKIGHVFNQWAGLAMTKIGAVMGIRLPEEGKQYGEAHMILLNADYNIYSSVPPDVTFQPSYINVTPNGQFVVVTGAGKPNPNNTDYDPRPRVFYGDLGRLCQVYPSGNEDVCGEELTSDSGSTDEGGNNNSNTGNNKPDEAKELEKGVLTPSAALTSPPPQVN